MILSFVHEHLNRVRARHVNTIMKSNLPRSRRRFLQCAALAGAAPLILPPSVWAAESKPSEQVTMGFIGVGKQNRFLLDGFLSRPGTRVLAVCDVDTTRRENAKSIVEKHYAEQMTSGDYQGCATYPDFRELLARKDIDAVVIATPDHWHALTAIAACDAGKDVYCEKPMAHTVLEGRAMVKAARRNKRVFQVGSMQRSMSEFRAACELVRNGCLGKISHVEVSIGGPAQFCNLPEEPAEPGLDWNRWLGPAPGRPYNSILSPRGVHDHFPDWRKYREYGSGAIGDWGAHHFDIAQWGLGFDDSGPVKFIPSPAFDNPQEGARFQYANGIEVIHKSGNDVVFYGEAGKIEVNRGVFKLWLGTTLKTEDRKESARVLQELLPANAVRLYASGDHLADFLNSVRTRRPPICDVEIGHRTATICNLVSQVYYHGQTLEWDPKAEAFVNGTGNPQWLTKEYRAPWKVA